MTDRPSIEWTLLEMARVMSQRGTCARAQVGCVIAVNDRVCATGFNGAPHGVPHCEHPADEPVDAACQLAVHAEANAIVFAARHGVSIADGVLYTTLSPCLACSLLILNTGITRVTCAVQYRDRTGIDLLVRSGVDVSIRESDRRSTVIHGTRWSQDPLRGQRRDGV